VKPSNKMPTEHLLETIQQQEEMLEDFKRVNKILENICSIIQVDETLKCITEETLKLCNASQASLLLVGKKEREAITILREGESKKERLDFYLNRLLAGWVSKHKLPLLTPSLVDTFGSKSIPAKYEDVTSALSVPLFKAEKVIGVINLITTTREHLLSERELRLMNILSPVYAQFIQNAHLYEELFAENAPLHKEIVEKYALKGIIGSSPKMRAVYSLLEKIIPTDVQVLLEGESGTGKEKIAQAIHENSGRKEKPFVVVDCSTLPANLLESELFGHVKGAFTGASHDRKGLFEEAHHGTLFLDEIVGMPFDFQGKFLRAIQEGEFRPLGTTQIRRVDVRIIAAASRSLQNEVEAGNFRQDLFYRLNVVRVCLPPLRERKEDIPILAIYFLTRMNERHGKNIKEIKPEVITYLESYPWPGNIRQLEKAIEQAVVLCESNHLSVKNFAFLQTQLIRENVLFRPRPMHDAINEFKKQFMKNVLESTGGNQTEAARILEIQRSYLNQMIKKHLPKHK